jgi:hypothetical protein
MRLEGLRAGGTSFETPRKDARLLRMRPLLVEAAFAPKHKKRPGFPGRFRIH